MVQELGDVRKSNASILDTNSSDGVVPDLSGEALVEIRQTIDDCLTGRGGQVPARIRAAKIREIYIGLNQTGQRRFLEVLAQELLGDGLSQNTGERFPGATDSRHVPKAGDHFGQSFLSPRIRLLTLFNALPEGMKFLVRLRADILEFLTSVPSLKGLEADVTQLLTSWFDVGFLTLQRITWDSPASLLEKLISYEAVHEIQSWDDLKKRVAPNRRCFAFFHPSMPAEPLIFVEIGFTNGISKNIQCLLDEENPMLKPSEADTAMFYSISNTQKGLVGINFGDFLLKYVFEKLASEFGNLKNFFTLSPIPGFVKWLNGKIQEGNEPLFRDDELVSIFPGENGGDMPDIRTILRPGWHGEEEYAEKLKRPLLRLCARYLAVERSTDEAADPVAEFHLTNGSSIESLNWLANISPRGLRQSAGIMVNYNYAPTEIESCHDNYSRTGKVSMSAEILHLLAS